MKNVDKRSRQLDEILAQVDACYPNAEINQLAIDIWHKSLKPYSIENISTAFQKHIQTSTFLPTVAEILTILREIENSELLERRKKQASLPMPRLTEEQIEANLKRIREWKEKKWSGMLKTVDSQEVMDPEEKIKLLRRQAQELKDGPDLDEQ